MWSRCNSPISPDKTPPHMLCPSLLSVLEHSLTTLFSGLPCLECPSLHPFWKIASSGKPSLSGKASVEISSSYYTLYSTMYRLGSSYHNCNFYPSWEILSSVDIPFSPTPPFPPQRHRQWLLFLLLCFQCPTPGSTQSPRSLCVDGLNKWRFQIHAQSAA